jgi:hypothetical protein
VSEQKITVGHWYENLNPNTSCRVLLCIWVAAKGDRIFIIDKDGYTWQIEDSEIKHIPDCKGFHHFEKTETKHVLFQGPGAYELVNGQQVVLGTDRVCQKSDGVQSNSGVITNWQWVSDGKISGLGAREFCQQLYLAEFLDPLPELPDGFKFTEPKRFDLPQVGDWYCFLCDVMQATLDHEPCDGKRWIVEEVVTGSSLSELLEQLAELTAKVQARLAETAE